MNRRRFFTSLVKTVAAVSVGGVSLLSLAERAAASKSKSVRDAIKPFTQFFEFDMDGKKVKMFISVSCMGVSGDSQKAWHKTYNLMEPSV